MSVPHSRPDILNISTAKYIHCLGDGQSFYETPKAYEIWDENPLRMVKRIPKKAVLLIWIK